MRKTRWVAAAAAAVTAISLGGCAAGPAEEDKELILWHMESTPNRVAVFNAIAEQYNATDPEYPVTIQVQEWDQVYAKIAAAAQSGDQPDILFSIPDFTTYVRQLGLGQPMTEIVEALDDEKGISETASQPYFDDEEYWAVPLYGMVQMLWYRADLLEAAGVTPPRTWDELLTAAEALTTDDQSGIAIPAGKNLASDQVIYSLMTTGGAADFFTEDGEINFDTPETVAAYELYNELLKYSPTDSGAYAWGEPQAAFNSGAAAMAIEKGQYLSPFEAESGRPGTDLGCLPIPVKDEGGEPGSIYYSNGAMILSEDQARMDGASEFFDWLLQPEQYSEFLNAEPGLFLPVTEDEESAATWRTSDVVSQYPECVDAMLEQAESGELFGFVDGQYIDVVGEISGQNFLAQGVQEMYVNGKTPEEAVAWTQQQMQDAVE